MPLSTEQQQIITRVRAFTTDSTTEVSDDKILYFAGQAGLSATDASYQDNIIEGVLDTPGVIADVWTYIARSDRYMAESEGSVSQSQPTALKMAAVWRAQSMKGGGGVSMGMTQTERLDLLSLWNGLEFGV
jgi:hypothetical protein